MLLLLKNATASDGSTDILVDRFPFRIGRSSEAERPMAMIFVSRFHCRFTLKDGEIYLEDLQSANGTFVNRKRITEPTPVRHGDEISLGPMLFRALREGIKVEPDGKVKVLNPGANEISTVVVMPGAEDPQATLKPIPNRPAKSSNV
jgi:pSer/pThr/pTyr-binding forkhead associated (FHA) protein